MSSKLLESEKFVISEVKLDKVVSNEAGGARNSPDETQAPVKSIKAICKDRSAHEQNPRSALFIAEKFNGLESLIGGDVILSCPKAECGASEKIPYSVLLDLFDNQA